MVGLVVVVVLAVVEVVVIMVVVGVRVVVVVVIIGVVVVVVIRVVVVGVGLGWRGGTAGFACLTGRRRLRLRRDRLPLRPWTLLLHHRHRLLFLNVRWRLRWPLLLECDMGEIGRAVVSGLRSRWRPLPLLRGDPPVRLIVVVTGGAGVRRRISGVSGLFPLFVRPSFFRHFQVGVSFFFGGGTM